MAEDNGQALTGERELEADHQSFWPFLFPWALEQHCRLEDEDQPDLRINPGAKAPNWLASQKLAGGGIALTCVHQVSVHCNRYRSVSH